MKKYVAQKSRGVTKVLKRAETNQFDLYSTVKKSTKIRELIQQINSKNRYIRKKITKDEIKKALMEDFDVFIAVWGKITNEKQEEYKEVIIELLDETINKFKMIYGENDYLKEREVYNNLVKSLSSIWLNTNKNIQRELLFEIVKKAQYIPEIMASIFHYTNNELKSEQLINITKFFINKATNEAISKWGGDIEDKIKYESIDKKIIPPIILNFWNSLPEDVQKQKLPEMLNLVKHNQNTLVRLWSFTKPLVQVENSQLFEEIKDKAINNLVLLWKGSCEHIQKNNIDFLNLLIENSKDNQNKIYEIFNATKKEVITEDILLKFIEIEKDNDTYLSHILNSTFINPKRILTIIEIIKDNPDAIAILLKTKSININFKTLIKILQSVEIINENVWEIIRNQPYLYYQVIENIDLILEKMIGNKNTKVIEEAKEIFKNLSKKNINLIHTINLEFLIKNVVMANEKNNKYTEEQLLRITNYPSIQKFLLDMSDVPVMNKIVENLMKNETNWIISLNCIMKRINEFSSLINQLKQEKDLHPSDNFIKKLTIILSDDNNYFNIENIKDVENYFVKKNKICLDILHSDIQDFKEEYRASENKYKTLKEFAQSQYKFALLEYKFGISLNDSIRLLNRYAIDIEELPDCVETRYLKCLKKIIYCENIDEVIKDANIKEPWTGELNARNVEGNIMNIYAKVYNETLYDYRKNQQDKLNKKEIYIDEKGIKHEIDVYSIKDDFNMLVRVEGAYIWFEEPYSFVNYYEQPNIDNHGNCESYIGNDSISIVRNYNGIIVGYSYIGKNNLTAFAPYDIDSGNKYFSNYIETTEARTPKKMIDNTRNSHNEFVQDRVIIDKDGNVHRLKPDFVVWLEEEPDAYMNSWVKRESKRNIKKWKMTKKAAYQLRDSNCYN